MKKRLMVGFLAVCMTATMFTGCGNKNDSSKTDAANKSGEFKESSVTVAEILNNVSEDEVTGLDFDFGIKFDGDVSVKSNNEFTSLVVQQLGSNFGHDLNNGITLDAEIKSNGTINTSGNIAHTKLDVPTITLNSNVEAINKAIEEGLSEEGLTDLEAYMDFDNNVVYAYTKDEGWSIDSLDDQAFDMDYNLVKVDREKLVDVLSKIGEFSSVKSTNDTYAFDFNFTMTNDMTDDQKQSIKELVTLVCHKDSQYDVVEPGIDVDSMFSGLDQLSEYGDVKIPVKTEFEFIKSGDTYKLNDMDMDFACDINIELSKDVLSMLFSEFSDDPESLSQLDGSVTLTFKINSNVGINTKYETVNIEIPSEAKEGVDNRDIESDDFDVESDLDF